MLACVVGDLLKMLMILSPMFCGCCLIQKGGTRRNIQTTAKKIIQEKLDIDPSYQAPQDNELYLRRVLQLMDYADDQSNILLNDGWLRPPLDSAIKKQRLEARDRLAKNLAHCTINQFGRIVEYRHGCQLGCHTSRRSVLREINEDLGTCQLQRHVSIPAINRWLLLFMPIAYWSNGILLGFLADALKHIVEQKELLAPLVEADLFGMEFEDTFQKKKQRRFRCVNGWAQEDMTGRKLAIAAILVSVLVQHMGYFFQDAKHGETRSPSAGRGFLAFCCEETNPCCALLGRIFGLLMDDTDIFWIPAKGPHAWNQLSYGMVSTCVERVVGGLKMRLVDPFVSKFPGRLGQVGNARVAPAKQRSVGVDLHRCVAGCFENGVSAQVRNLHPDVDSFLDDGDLHEIIRQGFKDCPMQNIPNEFRFARQQAYTNVQRGNYASHFTVAARHVLPESQATHRTHMKRLHSAMQLDCDDAGPRAVKRRRSGFALYCHTEGLGGATASYGWHALSGEDKATWASTARNEYHDAVNAISLGDTRSIQERMAAAVELGDSPFGVASVQYPMSNAHTSAVIDNVDAYARAWRNVVGNLIGPQGSGLDAPVFHQCCDLYGPSTCGLSLNQAAKDRIQRMKRLFVAASKLPHEKLGGIELSNLIMIEVPGGPAAHDDPAGGAQRTQILILKHKTIN
jgi:hypothetical protein